MNQERPPRCSTFFHWFVMINVRDLILLRAAWLPAEKKFGWARAKIGPFLPNNVLAYVIGQANRG